MRSLTLLAMVLSIEVVSSFTSFSFPLKSSAQFFLSDTAIVSQPDTAILKNENSKTKIDSSVSRQPKPEAEPVKNAAKIIKFNGDELKVIIKEKNVFEVKFYVEGSNKLQAMNTAVIKEIRYADGRVELLDTTPEKRHKDWTITQTKAEPDSTVIEGDVQNTGSETIDTIIKQNGKKLNVIIKEKNIFEVKYRLPKGKTIYSMNTSMIKEIHYADGRIVEIDNNPEKKPKDWTVTRAVRDWEEVVVTYNQEEVASLVEKGPVEVEFTPDKLNATNEFLEKSATVVMKKKASKMKATTVLITDKSFNRQYGELPTIYLKGIAYSKP